MKKWNINIEIIEKKKIIKKNKEWFEIRKLIRNHFLYTVFLLKNNKYLSNL